MKLSCWCSASHDARAAWLRKCKRSGRVNLQIYWKALCVALPRLLRMWRPLWTLALRSRKSKVRYFLQSEGGSCRRHGFVRLPDWLAVAFWHTCNISWLQSFFSNVTIFSKLPRVLLGSRRGLGRSASHNLKMETSSRRGQRKDCFCSNSQASSSECRWNTMRSTSNLSTKVEGYFHASYMAFTKNAPQPAALSFCNCLHRFFREKTTTATMDQIIFISMWLPGHDSCNKAMQGRGHRRNGSNA